MVQISLQRISKRFDQVQAVQAVSLAVAHGELFTLLGPSGCGKTTLLRIIAGFELPDEGRLYFDTQDITMLAAHRRNIGMVFQNYALWSHMTVFDNVAYGLKVRKLRKPTIRERVEATLRLVELEGLDHRTPLQLSGGQQQRVALARALVIEPQVLLLDEPLSNLDAKLRLEVRAELKRLITRLRLTAIYVTHDQEEAMSISDRIAVMNQGMIQQVGSPREIYQAPQTPFVADFIGQSSFFDGRVVSIADLVEVETPEGLHLRGRLTNGRDTVKPGDTVVVSIRPESFELDASSPSTNLIPAQVDHTAYLGSTQRVYLTSHGKRVIAELRADRTVRTGQQVELRAPCDQTLVIALDKRSTVTPAGS